MKVDLEFVVCNLAELVEACQIIQKECNAAAGRSVDPSEILVDTSEFNRTWLTVRTDTLTDASEVYNVVVH